MALYLIVGGAGRTGRRVAQRLQTRGYEVRVLSRHASTDDTPGHEVVRGDLSALTADHPALADIDGVVISVEPPSDAVGADAVLHRAVAGLSAIAAARRFPVILVSQIYVTRPDAYPQMAAVIDARGRGEQALRDSGAAYVIVRPAWLHDRPGEGIRLEQGDTGDGPVSREAVAEVCVVALLDLPETRLTLEVFDGPSETATDLAGRLSRLIRDPVVARAR